MLYVCKYFGYVYALRFHNISFNYFLFHIFKLLLYVIHFLLRRCCNVFKIMTFLKYVISKIKLWKEIYIYSVYKLIINLVIIYFQWLSLKINLHQSPASSVLSYNKCCTNSVKEFRMHFPLIKLTTYKLLTYKLLTLKT